MLCIVYICSMFVCMKKLACTYFSCPSYSLVVLVIIYFCIVEPFNFTLYTKKTYVYTCDRYGLVIANTMCPFGGTSLLQLYIGPDNDDINYTAFQRMLFTLLACLA